jgi:hypothetical protein
VPSRHRASLDRSGRARQCVKDSLTSVQRSASMTMGLIALVAASWLVSAYLAVRLWRARENAVLKRALTAVLFIPALGPLFFLWIRNFPPSMPVGLMDRSGYSTDVLDRFRYRLERSGHLLPSKETALRALLRKSMSGIALSKAGKRGGQKSSSVDGSSMHALAEKRSEPRNTSPTMRCSRLPRRRGSG